MNPYWLSKNEVCEKGLRYVRDQKASQTNTTYEAKAESFHHYYGSTPSTVTQLWHDLIPVLSKKDQSEKGFHQFMIAIYFLCILMLPFLLVTSDYYLQHRFSQ